VPFIKKRLLAVGRAGSGTQQGKWNRTSKKGKLNQTIIRLCRLTNEYDKMMRELDFPIGLKAYVDDVLGGRN
jgi:hypothetical protein